MVTYMWATFIWWQNIRNVISACRNNLVSITLTNRMVTNQWERQSCTERFSPFNVRWSTVITFVITVLPATAYAQTAPAIKPDVSVSDIKAQIEPISDFIATVIAQIASFIAFFFQTPTAAILTSAVLAFIITAISIRSQREMTRLRETFVTIDRGNWDKDLIKNRRRYREIRDELLASKESIAKYHSPAKDDMEDAVVLHNMLKDYENLALGVRHNILDEVYLCRWMRSTLIHDWTVLSPLVTAYRSVDKVPTAYIEFEGLATAWQNNRSYKNGRKIKTAKRSIRVK